MWKGKVVKTNTKIEVFLKWEVCEHTCTMLYVVDSQTMYKYIWNKNRFADNKYEFSNSKPM